MDKHRFPQKFMQSVIALGAGALLYSLYRLPFAQLNAPFLLLALIAVWTSSRYPVPLPRSRGQVSVLNSFVLLALLLFGGDAAILFAAVTGLCLALRHGRNVTRIFFDASVPVVSTLLVVWTLRLIFGLVAEQGPANYSLDFFQALSLAALIQAAAATAITAVGEAYQIKQSVWRHRGAIFCWTFLTFLAGSVAAGIGAWLIVTIGAKAFVLTTIVAAIALFGYENYKKNSDTQTPQAERYGAAVKDTSERFRSAFDHAAIGMALVSPEGRWLQVNRSLCKLLGYSERELMATDYLRVIHPNDLSAALANIKELLRGKVPSCQMEKRYVDKHGQEVWVLWSASLAQDAYTKTPHLIYQIQDITDRKQAEEKLLHDAFHDALTGLPNRALFMDHLKLAIARLQRRENQIFAVLYLDLDRFKIINDSLGHMIGDQLLVGIARRLENCLRPGDTIARLGGDEFTVLLEDINDDNDVAQIAERIQIELSAPFNLSGREVFTTVSMGVALSSKEYERSEDILRDADTAMYRAKSLGKARHEVFNKGMHAQAIKLLQLETDLRRAVEREEFFILYQPIMSLETGRLSGFEALVRWRHPERGLISPADFIPVAEETGLIVQIGEWVLREACHQMHRWQVIFPSDPPMFMSVNLSVKQFSQPNLIERVARILNETKLYSSSLKLEITESAVMENVGTATELLKQLRALGVQLSMDDFGTGYSSLSYLHRFPIDTLKIDRSFVTQMAENNENAEIVRTIVGLAQNLGMDVVAEGVETLDQLEMLKSLGCECGQGYFFSKPLDKQDAEKFIGDTYAPDMAMLDEPEPLSSAWIS